MIPLPVIRSYAPVPGTERPPQPPAPPEAVEEGERLRIARDLANAVEGEVRFGRHDRMLYATDASMYQVEPVGVVIPSSVEDAVRVVRFCAERGLPILPRGGGTSLAGQCTNRAVVVDFSANCRAVLEVDAAGRRCRVEPGITVDDLNDALNAAGSGLFFAPDPATSRQANIGGCIGNNAAGARSIMYGRTSENLLGVDVCLADGTTARFEAGAASRDPRVREISLRVAEVVRRHEGLIRERFPRTIRRNAGYNLDLVLQQMDAAGPRADAGEVLDAINLAHLVCGSEGTLAVTLGAELLLRPLPRAKGLAVVGFASLEEAIEAVRPILETGPSAVELLDDTVLDLALNNIEYRRYVELMPAPAEGLLRAALYVEYFGFGGDGADPKAEIEAKLSELKGVLTRGFPAARAAAYTDAPAMARAWKLRKAGEPLLHGMPGDRKPVTFVEDNAVPVENLGAFVREFKRICGAHGTAAAYWAHASVGVLHIRPFLNVRDEADRERLRSIAVEAADLARSLGGVMSGEHGDGKVRGPLLERFYGPELMRAFREVKGIFDPRNLLNPGTIVEPGPVASITERTRINPLGREVRVPAVETYYTYDDQHGFDGAVEMCNGAGVCRKKSGGTMCPSYMGSLDERHSTRGRGNALRLAITGQLSAQPGAPAWDDPGTIETLDLCLSCKACKTECPSNVDIARLKAEYTAQRYRAKGRAPLAAVVFGHVRTLNRLGSLAPRLANWVNRQPWARAVADRLLGLAPRRSLPAFDVPLARRWGGIEREKRGDGASPRAATVALFGDCFTGYNEPRIGLAAKRVLEAFGYRVVLADAGCCARALISTGLLEDAIGTADATLERLAPLIKDADVKAVLVLEPSCLSSFKDDWLQLKLRAPMALREGLAAKAMLVEDFLDRYWEAHPRRPDFAPHEGSVILHGHCHQKALWGVETSAGLLRRLAGDKLRVLDSGCCGMAGSFGFQAHRYDLSMRIGEQVLFPAVRRAAAAGPCAVAAPGTSCRHQIHDGTRIAAEHPIEIVERLLSVRSR